MDRFARVRNDITPTDSVCRCLFGPLDRDQNVKFMNDFMAEQSREMNKQYNFNFSSGVPLKGRFDWVKVPSNDQENIPKVYSLPQLMGLTLSKESPASKDDELTGGQLPKVTAEMGDSQEQDSHRMVTPKSHRELFPTVCPQTNTESSQDCSSIGNSNVVNKEQCVEPPTSSQQQGEELPSKINSQSLDANTADAIKSRFDLTLVSMVTESTPGKRKQSTIPDFFSIRKRQRQEEKTE